MKNFLTRIKNNFIQLEQFAGDIFSTMDKDSHVSSKPISYDVNTPSEIYGLFEDILYNKAYYLNE